MRVLLLVGHAAGGIGAHVQSLAAGLATAGLDVLVATSASTADRFDLPGARVLWPQGPPWVRLARLGRLRRLAASADVVHAHGHQAGVVALAVVATLPRGQRPVVVVSWHNAVLGSGPLRWGRALLERLQARRAQLVTGASPDLVGRALALGARSPRLAPVAAPAAGAWAGATAAVRGDLEAAHGVPSQARLVLTVARVAPQKRLDVLVAAASRLRARQDLWWLVAGAGDPVLLAQLQAQASSGGARVRFLGARADVGALMAVADVLVVTSSWEARALVVQEAMAAGLPVVATDAGGLAGLLGPAGVLVPVGDDAAVAAAVSRLLDDPAERARLGAAGLARFATLPDERDVVGIWVATYTELATR